jgi:hypothetical protein
MPITYEIDVDGKRFEIESDDTLSNEQLIDYAKRYKKQVPDIKLPEKEKRIFGLPETAEAAMFPITSQLPSEEKKKIDIPRAFIQGLEFLSAPERATAKIRGQKMSDPQATLWRPEIEKIKKKIPEPKKGMPLSTPALARGAVELLGSLAGDPTLGLGVAAKLGKGALRKTIAKTVPSKVKKEFAEKAAPIVGPQEIIESAAPEKKFMARLSQADRSILNEPLKELDTPFKEYADIANSAVANPRNPTPLDVAGRKAVKALDKISETRKGVGKAQGELLEANRNEVINVADVKQQWEELLESRLMAEVKEGDVVNTFNPRNPITKPSEKSMILEIDNIIKNMDDEVLVPEANGLKSAIFDIVNNFKATQARPINTVTEGIGKTLSKGIDDKLDNVLGREFQDINDQYAKLKNMEQFLSRKVGPLMETEGIQQAERGASLLKSSLQSNSDRNTRILFKEIEEITGYDLIKDAKFAEIAMRSVDDPRIKGLLEEVGALRRAIPGKVGMIAETLSELSKKARKPLIEEAVKESEKEIAERKIIEFIKKLSPRGKFAYKGMPGITAAALQPARSKWAEEKGE